MEVHILQVRHLLDVIGTNLRYLVVHGDFRIANVYLLYVCAGGRGGGGGVYECM